MPCTNGADRRTFPHIDRDNCLVECTLEHIGAKQPPDCTIIEGWLGLCQHTGLAIRLVFAWCRLGGSALRSGASAASWRMRVTLHPVPESQLPHTPKRRTLHKGVQKAALDREKSHISPQSRLGLDVLRTGGITGRGCMSRGEERLRHRGLGVSWRFHRLHQDGSSYRSTKQFTFPRGKLFAAFR